MSAFEWPGTSSAWEADGVPPDEPALKLAFAGNKLSLVVNDFRFRKIADAFICQVGLGLAKNELTLVVNHFKLAAEELMEYINCISGPFNPWCRLEPAVVIKN